MILSMSDRLEKPVSTIAINEFKKYFAFIIISSVVFLVLNKKLTTIGLLNESNEFKNVIDHRDKYYFENVVSLSKQQSGKDIFIYNFVIETQDHSGDFLAVNSSKFVVKEENEKYVPLDVIKNAKRIFITKNNKGSIGRIKVIYGNDNDYVYFKEFKNKDGENE